MFAPLSLGRIFGIPLRVHWTFWLLPLWMVLSRESDDPIALHLLILFALFACVLLHELGHALAARCFHIRTRDITLYPIGGAANLERISEKPIEELVIAVAGPAVNVVIAALLILGFLLTGLFAPAALTGTPLGACLSTLVLGNVIMILFNMIPAFPLDGGRVLRALLGMRMSHLEATRRAVRIGSVVTILGTAAMFVFWPQYASPFLIVIAFFLLTIGRRELAVLEYRERARRWTTVNVAESSPPVNEPNPWPAAPVKVYVLDRETGLWVAQGGSRPT